MRILLGATIGLLALVSAGLAVFAYTAHREVAYLTLRADHLESRINELEAPHSTVDNLEADTDASAAMPSLSPEERAKLEETNRIRKDNHGLDPMTEREYRALHPSASTPTPTTDHQRSSWYQSFVTPTPTPEPVEPTPTPEPVVYTDQELYDSREEGPNRPNCPDPNERIAPDGSYRPWWYTGFVEAMIEAGACVTVEERLDGLERVSAKAIRAPVMG
jgi:hypothetical protein